MVRKSILVLIFAGVQTLAGPSFALSDLTQFDQSAFAQPSEIVSCTLEDGTPSECAKIVVTYLPDGLEIGPFCPTTLTENGGIWDWGGDQPGLYRINEDFLRMLDALGYTFYDADDTVHIAGVDREQPAHDHACINMSLDESVTMTVLLPTEPIRAEEPAMLGTVAKVGLALDGVPIFSDAPTIQRTGHMPALDTCGGHVDPGGWYHWHATSSDIKAVFEREDVNADCALPQDATALFGYAFDGFPIYGSAEMDGAAPADLDACNGHVGPTAEYPDGAYHYHASTTFPNLPKCLVGVQAQNNFSTTAIDGIGSANAGANGPPPGAGGPGDTPPGFEQAAQALGVTLDELMLAVRNAGGPQLDFAAAAAALGVSEDDLRSALPPPPAPRN